ncbi:MAG: RNA polymerase factor sigma-54 [Deltaproteobacteria bacterium]|nr:RNA polymerase factor sigma-54 [Deltaproteobacteria bacterium]
MEIKQQLRQSQQLVMTPQLQQAIKLLQMSRMELVDMVRDELMENPVLEDQAEIGEVSPRVAEIPQQASQESRSIEQAVALDDRASEKSVAGEEKKVQEIDWERYLENHSMQAPMPSSGRMSDEDLPGVEATLTKREDLAEHIAWQVRLSDLSENELIFAALVVGNLDDNGYLKLEDTPLEEVVPKLAAEAELDAEDAEEVLKIIQRMDPVGVASRDLRECLMVQADVQELDPLVIAVLDKHLSNLEKKNYAAIARDLKVEVEEIYDVAQAIAELEPRPGRDYVSEDPRYIVPDVYVSKVGEGYVVSANDDGMPRLKISGFYRAAMAGDPKAKEYIQTKLRSAQWLIRSIDQRRKTIVRVTECIVEKQKDFFDFGIEHLKPMILRDVAETVGMHESTISRVTSNKYVATPRGVLELKFFFNSAIRRESQEDIASESVKQAIKKIIGEEDTRNPHSDQKIVEILAQGDIIIARRTVAKYREMLGILSSAQRKKYF